MNGLDQLLVARQTIEYLDAVRRLPVIAAGKRLILDSLDLRPGRRVLNVGCGTGEDVWAMAERVSPGGLAEGIDLNPWTVGEARRRAADRASDLPVTFTVGDVYALPYRDVSVDAVCSERMFTHLTDPLRAMGEIHRVLRPGGVVVIADPDFATLRFGGFELPLTDELGRAKLAAFADGRAGSQLRERLRATGFVGVAAEAVKYVGHGLDDAETLFSLRETSDVLIETGAATPSEVEGWWSAAREAERRGDLTWRIVGYVARGRRPASADT